MSNEKIRVRLASDELIDTAISLLGDGELSVRERITMAIQLDSRADILELKNCVDRINNHPLHRLSIKGVSSIVAILTGLTALATWLASLL